MGSEEMFHIKFRTIIESKDFNITMILCLNKLEEGLNVFSSSRFWFHEINPCTSIEIIYHNKKVVKTIIWRYRKGSPNVTMNKIKNRRNKLTIRKRQPFWFRIGTNLTIISILFDIEAWNSLENSWTKNCIREREIWPNVRCHSSKTLLTDFLE